MSADEIGSLLERFGLPLFLLALILWTGARGIWTWGRETRRERERGDRYEAIALRALDAAEGGTEVAKVIAEEQRRKSEEIAAAVAEHLSRKAGP